jgi:cell division protein FtsB
MILEKLKIQKPIKIPIKAILAVAVLICLLITVLVLKSQIDALNEQKDILAATVKLYQDEVDELQYDFTLSEKEYIEKYAREQLGFHKTGEIVFKKSN